MKIDKNKTNSQILAEIAKRAKDLRISLSLTQQDLSRHAGISLKTLSRFENGENVKVDVLLNVLRALGCIENIEILLADTDIDLESLIKKKKPQKRVRQKQ